MTREPICPGHSSPLPPGRFGSFCTDREKPHSAVQWFPAAHQPVAEKKESVIQKHYPNSFRETPLLEFLRGEKVKALVIAGMMTPMCVEATTRAAFDLCFDCTVVQDACATRALTFQGRAIPATEVHAAFLAALGSVYAKVVDAADFLADLPSTDVQTRG